MFHWKTRERLIEGLKERARQIRVHVVKMAALSDSHVGGSFSMAEVTAALYFHILRVDPQNPDWDGRDYLLLSKGHTVPAIYAALAERGFFPIEELATSKKLGSRLGGHATTKTPGIELSTGSLGHGLSVGVGIAIALKADKKDNRVFVILGDGELQEGSVWEAAMAASHHKLDNLIAIVDRNWYQADRPTEEVLAVEPLTDKWRAFGWAVNVIDGHDMSQVVEALENVPIEKGKPTCIIAQTVKGKGVSFTEATQWHVGKFTKEQEMKALRELGWEG